MSQLREDKEREQLEREVQAEKYGTLLLGLRKKHPFWRQFSTWGDVVAFMRNGESEDPEKDKILRLILAAHARSGDYRWRTILLAFFWPGLRALSLRLIRWDPQYAELWARSVCAFIETVRSLDVVQCPDRLAATIMSRTAWRLRKEYREERAQTEMEVPTEAEELERAAGGGEDPGLRELEQADEKQADLLQILMDHLQAGHINELDFNLIVGTRIYGKSLSGYAEEFGLTYQVAKRRRLRAEAIIRRLEESA